MANIQTFIQRIKSAIYGRDVRQSICDAIEAIDDEVVAAHEEMSEFVQSEMDDTLTSPTLPAQAKAVGDAIANIRIDLDTTLSHAGEAADAKAVGDAITAATVAIDDTLTETGEAADAKKTGDEITGLKNALNEIDERTEITAETESGTFHSEDNIKKIVVHGNDFAFGTVRLADKKNVFPHYSANNGIYNNVNYYFNDRFLKLSGTSSSTSVLRTIPDLIKVDSIPSGNYKIIIQQNGTFNTSDNPWFCIEAVDSEGQTYELKNKEFNNTNFYVNNSSQRIWNTTISADIVSIRFIFCYSGNTTFNDVTIWFGIYDSEVIFEDKNITITPELVSEIAVGNEYNNGIDTTQLESTAIYYPTVQEYIDQKEINIDDELTYITPEAFGAKGDGQTDDSSAFADCLEYANANGKSVRALQHYLITVPINIAYSYLDVYINHVMYTGSDAAIILKGRNNKINVNYINSTGTGFRLVAGLASLNQDSDFNEINFLYILSTNNSFECIHGDSDPLAQGYYAIYNSIKFEHLQSSAGNGIYLESTYGEKSFFGGSIVVNSGWSIMSYESVDTFYNICMESTHGVYLRGRDNAGNTFIGGRNRELCDKYGTSQTDQNLGVLFKFDHYGHDNIYIARDSLKACCIDISGRTGDVPDMFKGAVNMKFFGSCMSAGNAYYRVDGQEILVLPHRIVIAEPQSRECIVTDTTMDMRGYPTNYPLYTRFIAGANSTIYLNESYCSLGIKTFRVKQTNDYKLTVYDSLGNLVFDGANIEGGEYEITAVFNVTNENTVFNDGEHDSWEIVKLNIVS